MLDRIPHPDSNPVERARELLADAEREKQAPEIKSRITAEVAAGREIVLKAVKQNGYAFEDADKSLKADREIVLAAVKQTGSMLEYAAESLKADREVVLTAMKNWWGDALQYAAPALQRDKELRKIAKNQ